MARSRHLVDAEPSWMDDPHLARRLARATWLVLVATFVLLTRFEVESSIEPLVLALVVMVVGGLNAPVALGLYKSRREAHTPAFRMVAFALLVRALAAAWVIWILGSS